MTRLFIILIFLLTATLAHAAVTVTVNGTNHTIPQTNEKGWGNNVTAWIQAISANTLQPSGGAFTLTAETDFGSSYGLKSSYLKSRATNPASSGILRLGNAESIGWRNAANSANLLLTVDSSNNLTYGGVNLLSATNTATITGKTIDGDDNTLLDVPITSLKTVLADANKVVLRDGSGVITSALLANANVSGSAAIDYSKLNLATSIVNADVSSSAAIAYSKLAALASANILVGSAGNVATVTPVTGDISLTNAGVTAYSGTVPLNKGGTGQTTKAAAFDALSPMTTVGDVVYGGASGTGTRLPIGTAGQYLGTAGTGGTANTVAWSSFIPPSVQRFTSGSGTYNCAYAFIVTSASATVGATYTNNGNTYTVLNTISGATLLYGTAAGDPLPNGTLTKSGGTGDSTITFSAVRKPTYIEVEAIGGGGGGGGSGTAAGTAAGTGGTTTFGSSLITAPGGGPGGFTPAAGAGPYGNATASAPAIGIVAGGGNGSPGTTAATTGSTVGGKGGDSPYGGAGNGSAGTNAGVSGAGNLGGGGGGGGSASGGPGAGGGSGGYIKALIINPATTYAYAIGAGGTAGGAGTGTSAAGGAGGSGVIIVKAVYQ